MILTSKQKENMQNKNNMQVKIWVKEIISSFNDTPTFQALFHLISSLQSSDDFYFHSKAMSIARNNGLE